MDIAVHDSVFDELRVLMTRREELDRAIAALERIRLPGLHLKRRMEAASPSAPSGSQIGSELSLSRMNLTSAIVAVLQAAEGPLGNAEIVEALIRGGLRFRGMNPPLAVAQGLSRMIQKPGPVVKLGRGRWALAGRVAGLHAAESTDRSQESRASYAAE